MKKPPVKAPKRSKDPLPPERKAPLARRRATGETEAKVGTLLLRKGFPGLQAWRSPEKMIIILKIILSRKIRSARNRLFEATKRRRIFRVAKRGRNPCRKREWTK
jgi:hypothetical protein